MKNETLFAIRLLLFVTLVMVAQWTTWDLSVFTFWAGSLGAMFYALLTPFDEVATIKPQETIDNEKSMEQADREFAQVTINREKEWYNKVNRLYGMVDKYRKELERIKKNQKILDEITKPTLDLRKESKLQWDYIKEKRRSLRHNI